MSDRASSQRYDKPWLSVDDQLERLQHRGLVIEDRDSAARFIGHLGYIRNLCAHHSRLWDREWAVHPRLPDARLWHPPTVPNSRRLYITLLLIYRLLQRCSGCHDDAKSWRLRVTERIDTAPNTPRALELMGLHNDWHKHPYWV